MKIQNEKLSIINKINVCYQEKRFKEVIVLKNELFKFSFAKDDIFSFEKIIQSAFNLDDYKEIINISNILGSSGYESYITIYYTCLSFISLNNLYDVNLYIKSSQLLSDAYHKLLYASDGANYSNILLLDNKQAIYALIVVNFVLGLCREASRNNEDINQEYIFYRFMDLLNILVELSYPEKIVNKIYKDIKKIYKI